MITDGLIFDFTVNTGDSYDRLGKIFASLASQRTPLRPVELNANDLLFKGRVSLR